MSSQEKLVLVSACLAGQHCRYDASACRVDEIADRVKRGAAVPVCPEVLGGLCTPRCPAEIVGGDGTDVLARSARVIDREGLDVSAAFIDGAKFALRIGEERNIRTAWLKSRSPSCGAGMIYDGTFSQMLRDGDGVLAALLRQRGWEICSMK